MPKAPLLAEVEILMLFSPKLQIGGPRKPPADDMVMARHGYMTAQVYGNPGISDLTRTPIIEDLRVEVNGVDIEALIPDAIAEEITAYVMDL